MTGKCGSNGMTTGMVPWNQKLSFGLGVTLVICAVGQLACAICESVAIGKLTSSGAAYGFAFFNIAVKGHCFGAWRCPSVKCVRSLFWSALICLGIAVVFFILQIVRIVFIVGHESNRDGVTVEDVPAAATLFYVELVLLYIISLVNAVLCALAGYSTRDAGAKCGDQAQPNGEQPMQSY